MSRRVSPSWSTTRCSCHHAQVSVKHTRSSQVLTELGAGERWTFCLHVCSPAVTAELCHVGSTTHLYYTVHAQLTHANADARGSEDGVATHPQCQQPEEAKGKTREIERASL